MRGSIVKRSKTSWALVIDAGRDPVSGKRKQKWAKFIPTAKHTQKCNDKMCSEQCKAYAEAEAALAKLLHQVDQGTYVDASKLTLLEYLRAWHTKNVVPHRRPETARVYKSMIEGHIAKASLATVRLQKLTTSDLEAFYATLKLSASSVTVCHAVVGRALKIAVRDKLIVANPALAVEDRPRVSKDHGQGARLHCWTAAEARRVLTAAKDAGAQVSAFLALLLDTGCRKSEALGLTWGDVDLDAGTVLIAPQLEPHSREVPVWATTKTGMTRVVTLGPETVARLKVHKRAQATLKMAHRTTYADHGLVFAKAATDLQTPRAALGQPCRALVGHHFRQVVTAAGVRPIKVHGLRHTCATLLLQAGVPVQVVAQRLGHAQITMTLEVYAHALPDMQKDAAAKLGALLHG